MKDEPKKNKIVRFKPGLEHDICQIVFDKETAQDIIFRLEDAIKDYSGEFYYDMGGTITILQP